MHKTEEEKCSAHTKSSCEGGFSLHDKIGREGGRPERDTGKAVHLHQRNEMNLGSGNTCVFQEREA